MGAILVLVLELVDGEEGRRRKMLGAQIHIITAFNQVGDRKGEIEIVGSSLGWDGMNG